MLSLLTLLLTSLALSLLLTPLLRDFALRRGLVDKPDDARKIHRYPIPRIGGVPIFVSFAASVVLLALLPSSGAAATLRRHWPAVAALLPAVAVVFLTGLLDDLLSLRPWHKLAGQIAAAALASWAGVQIHALGGFSIAHTWWHVPVTILWLVGCANAFNLIDGVDGLAAGAAFFATLTMFVAALLSQNIRLMLATAPLAGALLGFLRYNFNPATVFLGDGGSLTLGFLLGAYGIIWSQKSATVLGITAPLMALSLPLLETAISIARRFLRGQPIFGADRGHIHHRLLDRGLTPRRVALLLYGVCGLAACASLLVSTAANQFAGLVLILFCAAVWLGIHQLGYSEFHEARRLILPRTFQRVLSAQLTVRRLEELLKAAQTLDECWDALTEAARSLGISEARLRVNGSFYHKSLAPTQDNWDFRIPLPESAYAEFAVPFRPTLQPMTLAPFAAAVREGFAPRIAALLPRQSLSAPN